MTLLGSGDLPGLKARGEHRLERDPILRNQRIRTESQRAHMKALIAVPPAKFPRGYLGRVERFAVELTRVAPGSQQLTEAQLAASLEPVLAGVLMHLGGPERCDVTYRQDVGPWAVRFRVSEAGESAQNSPETSEEPW